MAYLDPVDNEGHRQDGQAHAPQQASGQLLEGVEVIPGRLPDFLGVGQAVLPDFFQLRPRLSQGLPATRGFFRPPGSGCLGNPVHEFPGLA